jgi:hypothetical protein
MMTSRSLISLLENQNGGKLQKITFCIIVLVIIGYGVGIGSGRNVNIKCDIKNESESML